MKLTDPISRRWKIFLAAALLCGIALRFIFPEDMEYKRDEEYNFLASQAPWGWIGMPSGAHIRNPGMSVWVFKALAALTRARTPIELKQAVALVSILGLLMIFPLARRLARTGRCGTRIAADHEPWFWAFALAMVNPIGVMYQRKLWPEPFLPLLTALCLLAWHSRMRRTGAFFWGLIGAALGQVHMSGFFLAAALWLWTVLFDRRASPQEQPQWRFWFAGSVLGSLTLIPWLLYLVNRPAEGPSTLSGLGEAIQLRFYVFWASNPLGLHLGNVLGLHQGASHFTQLSKFLRFPAGTWAIGVAHVLALIAAVVIFGTALRRAIEGFRTRPAEWRSGWSGGETGFVQNAFFWGYGLLLTATTLPIRRYYLMIAYPFEFIWLSRLALGSSERPERTARTCDLGRKALALLWIAELAISLGYVGYVHLYAGAPQGDYGDAYRVVLEKRQAGAAQPLDPAILEPFR